MRVQVDDRHSVTALLQVPPEAVASLIMAHGAGAGIISPSRRRSGLVSSSNALRIADQGNGPRDRMALAGALLHLVALAKEKLITE